MKNITKIIAAVLLLLSLMTTVVSAKEAKNCSQATSQGAEASAQLEEASPEKQYTSRKAFAISVNGDVNGDGKIDSLDAAQVLKYDAGIVTEFVNKEYNPTLTPEEERSLCEAYWEYWMPNKPYNEESNDVQVGAYYGTYNDGHTAYFWDSFLQEGDMVIELEIGGYIYTNGSTRQIQYVKDGMICTVEEAYTKGDLTDDDVYKILLQSGTLPANLWRTMDPIEKEYLSMYKHLVYNIFGDASGDRKVDSLDAAWILKYDAGLVE